MARELPTGYAALTEADTFYPVMLVELDWSTGAVRVWTGYGEISWNGNTYYGVGDLGGISPIGESNNLGANGVTLTLSGVPSDAIAEALTGDSQGRSGKVWIASLSRSGAFQADPYLIFDGLIDVTGIDDSGETATISVSLEKELIDRRSQSRRSTHEDQQIDYPGDLFFEYVAGLQNKVLAWGGKTIPGSSGTPGGVGGPYVSYGDMANRSNTTLA